MDYTLTKHVKERYAERIMNRDEETDVNRFIITHADKIEKDIEKMIEYGEVIYEGKAVKEYNKNPVKYILNGHWIVVVDTKASTVITIFKIDLGAGEEFNESYIDKMLEKINTARQKADEKVEEIQNLTITYSSLITENEEKIKELQQLIKSLHSQNENLKELIQEQKTNLEIAEQEIREIVKIMTTGSKF